MTEDKKRELEQLLSEALQNIGIQKSGRNTPDIDVARYKRLLHTELRGTRQTLDIVHRYFSPYITDESINVDLLNFVKSELSEYIDSNGHIVVSPKTHYIEFHHLLTQLLRLAICFDVEYAINEFNRCLTENVESFEKYKSLNGIEVGQDIQIFDGIWLIPIPKYISDSEQEISKFYKLFSKMPEALSKEQSDLRNSGCIRGETLLVSGCTVSPIFKNPSSEDVSPQSPRIKVGEINLNESNHRFFERFRLALSLVLNTDVLISTSWDFHDPRKLTNTSAIGSNSHGGSKGIRINKTFSINQVDEFKNIFNQLDSHIPENLYRSIDRLDAPGNIYRAIKRWTRVFSTGDPIDNMIDLRIAFEALYLGDGNKGEAKFRLSTRAAWHLETDNVEQRKKLHKFFRTFYDQSSSSVHSENIDDKKIKKMGYNREEFITKSQNLCRKAILKFLKSKNLPTKSEGWSDYWSNIIMGGGENI